MMDIRYTIRDKIRLPFKAIAAEALPKSYQLSLVICGDALAQKMNRLYRKKSYRPNVLSFPLSKDEGEIFLNIRKAEREARAIGISVHRRLAHLFVHGCLHLAGQKHSATMDARERRVLKKFGLA